MTGSYKNIHLETGTKSGEMLDLSTSPTSIDHLHSAVQVVIDNILKTDIDQFVGNNINGEYGNILSIMSDMRRAQTALEKVGATLQLLPKEIQRQISSL